MYGAASSLENHCLKTCYRIVTKITTTSLSLNIKMCSVLFVVYSSVPPPSQWQSTVISDELIQSEAFPVY